MNDYARVIPRRLVADPGRISESPVIVSQNYECTTYLT
jgi:hypothetical protein